MQIANLYFLKYRLTMEWPRTITPSLIKFKTIDNSLTVNSKRIAMVLIPSDLQHIALIVNETGYFVRECDIEAD